MKRGEFIRLSILAAIGVAVAPVISLPPSLPPLPVSKTFAFKVSGELLSDEEMWKVMLDDLLKDYKDRGNVVSMEVGLIDDDFVQNLHTVVLHLE